jgi:hypothetical protein
MTAVTFRRLALDLPEAVDWAHMGAPAALVEAADAG